MHHHDTLKNDPVAERDIDMLLMEEFLSESGFTEWFVAATAGWPTDGLRTLGAWHSVSSEHGESDLVVLVTANDGQRSALLIENKVNAPQQPDKASATAQGANAGSRRKAGSDLRRASWLRRRISNEPRVLTSTRSRRAMRQSRSG